jgi:hypothetical protein
VRAFVGGQEVPVFEPLVYLPGKVHLQTSASLPCHYFNEQFSLYLATPFLWHETGSKAAQRVGVRVTVRNDGRLEVLNPPNGVLLTTCLLYSGDVFQTLEANEKAAPGSVIYEPNITVLVYKVAADGFPVPSVDEWRDFRTRMVQAIMPDDATILDSRVVTASGRPCARLEYTGTRKYRNRPSAYPKTHTKEMSFVLDRHIIVVTCNDTPESFAKHAHAFHLALESIRIGDDSARAFQEAIDRKTK